MPQRTTKPLKSQGKPKKSKRKENKDDTVTICKPKRWNMKEVDKLKIALKMAVNPRTEADWLTIAKFVGQHNATDCQRKAEELNAQITETTLSPVLNENISENRLRRKSNKKITDKHEKSKRKIEPATLLSDDDDDFFANKIGMDSPLELDPNDSILYALLTPHEKVRLPRRPFFLSKFTYEKLSTNNENNISDDCCDM